MKPHPKLNLQYLRNLNDDLDAALIHVNNTVLDDPFFVEWPASPDKHHAHEGGLLLHTAEVVLGCVHIRKAAQAARNDFYEIIKWPVLFTAALWHDYGKLYDYERNPEWREEYEGYNQTAPGAEQIRGSDGKPLTPFRYKPHRHTIRHVSRSYAEWMIAAKPSDLRPEFIDDVGHCILAHHGRIEWGSPVEPISPEAFALHQADMISVKVFHPGSRT